MKTFEAAKKRKISQHVASQPTNGVSAEDIGRMQNYVAATRAQHRTRVTAAISLISEEGGVMAGPLRRTR